MSTTKTSFCEVTVTKSKQILLTIDLSKKEQPKKKSVTKPAPITPPQNLYEMTLRHIEDVTSKSNYKPLAQDEPDYTSKTLRKLAKKIIKGKKLRLSELANELGVSKNNLKSWLLKGEKEEVDDRDYDEILKVWVGGIGNEMTVEEIFDVIHRYTKSLYKSYSKEKQNPINANPRMFEAVILDNTFPKKAEVQDKKMVIEEPGASEQGLDLININVAYENVHIKDTVFWDSQDVNPDLSAQFAETMTRDFLEERAVNLPGEKASEIVKKIQRQIRRQIETANDLKAQTESLIAFNGNQTVYKQKECIIKIQIRIKQPGYLVEDTFDWEVDPVLNKPEYFAENYVKENQLPSKFANLIATQIRAQLGDFLRKRLNNFLKMYEPKIESNEGTDSAENKKKVNNKIKENILHSLNENLESFPNIPLPTKSSLFLKNADLFNTVKKYSDYLSAPTKKIFLRQKGLFEQNVKKNTKVESKKQQQYDSSTPPNLNDSGESSPQNQSERPHYLRKRTFNKNYRVLGGDLVNEPLAQQETEVDHFTKHAQNTMIKGPSLPSGLTGEKFREDKKMPIEDNSSSQRGTSSRFRTTPSIYRTNGKQYAYK